MFSAFDLTRPPPTAQDLETWRGLARRAGRDARFTAILGIVVAGAALVQALSGEEVVTSILTAGASLFVTAMALLARARFRKEWQGLKFFDLTPDQLQLIFVLTEDTRRYGAAVLAQRRTITLAELDLLRMYGHELGLFLRNLPVELKTPMAQHIGFHLEMEPVAA